MLPSSLPVYSIPSDPAITEPVIAGVQLPVRSCHHPAFHCRCTASGQILPSPSLSLQVYSFRSDPAITQPFIAGVQLPVRSCHHPAFHAPFCWLHLHVVQHRNPTLKSNHSLMLNAFSMSHAACQSLTRDRIIGQILNPRS